MTNHDQPEPPERLAVSRRSVLVGGSLLGAAAVLGIDFSAVACSSDNGGGINSSTVPFRAFTKHQAAVVEDATARLVPGPNDDPAEAGHPGAREANVVGYIDAVLGALHHDPAKVYAGGPFSNRAGNKTDDFAQFLALSPAVQEHWKVRLAGFRDTYTKGVKALDAAAGGDFTTASTAKQDTILAKNPSGFTDVLFQHTIEAMYGAPEYGGNKNLVGWHDIAFPGDVQPRGYTDDEVTRSDGKDVYQPTGIPQKALAILTATAPGSPNQPKIVGNH